jgi:uncharacterized protein (DUF342 family)
MVDFVQLQKLMKGRLEQDRNNRIVTVSGATLEDAVTEASVLLDLPVRKLEYEITERGSKGILGQGKKPWAIRAYGRLEVLKAELEGLDYGDEEGAEAPINEDADGEVFIHLSIDGAFLKVLPPKGKGSKVADSDALKLIHSRSVQKFDHSTVSSVVKEATGEYVKVGDFEHRPVNDSMVSVEITDAELKAYMLVTPPGLGGCDISVETYISFLRNNRVVYGINEEFLRKFADRPAYKEKVVVAEGLRPEDGRHAYIQYNFETDQNKIRLREGANGRIDFKDINIIKNVVENQPLAKKIAPEKGTLGRTVTGKFLPAKDGKDMPLPLGKNVHVGDDGVTILSDINGQVVLAGGKINVEPIYTVQ